MAPLPSHRPTTPASQDRINHDFVDAFECILTYPLDRRMLIRLCRADRELRYEELRKAVGSPHKQHFANALDRLISQILVNRRYIPQGERYQTRLSPTPRGKMIGDIAYHLSTEGALPQDLPPRARDLVKRVFSGEVDEPSDEPELASHPANV